MRFSAKARRQMDLDFAQSAKPIAPVKCNACHAPAPRLMCGVCGAYHFCSVECSDAIAELHAAVCHDKTSRDVDYVGKALEETILDMHMDRARYTPDDVADAMQVYQELHVFGDHEAMDEAHGIIGAHLYEDDLEDVESSLLHSIASHRLLVAAATPEELALKDARAQRRAIEREESKKMRALRKAARERLRDAKKQAQARVAPLTAQERAARRALRARRRAERDIARRRRRAGRMRRRASSQERVADRKEGRLQSAAEMQSAEMPIGLQMPALIPL